MTFFNSIKMCYMKSFDFKGRASKSEYWWFWLVQVPITFIALGTWNSEKFDVLSGVFLGITIASIPANLSSMIRRFHDAGLSTTAKEEKGSIFVIKLTAKRNGATA